jgi:vesicle transport through interaction with t-SNAREs protein 1
MEIEIQGIPQSIRPQYQTRLRSAKADLARYKKQYKDVHAQLARSALLSSSNHSGAFTSDEPYGPTSDRTRLLAGTSVLEDGTKRLQDSHRIALETENQGADILLNLRQQREQIINSRDTVRLFFRYRDHHVHFLQLQTANSSIDRASGTLKGMIRRYDLLRLRRNSKPI